MALWRRVACATSLEENAQEEPVFAPPEHVQEEKTFETGKMLKLETAAYRVACSSNSTCQDHDEPDPPGFLETGAAALGP